MRVFPIPLVSYDTNYAYLLIGQSKDHCFFVDPAESKTVLKFLDNHPGHKISHVLITHKHQDHVGDLSVLLDQLKERQGSKPEVVAGEADASNVPGASIVVKEQSSFDVNEIKVTSIPSPCHTMGSLLYFVEDKNGTDKHNDQTLIQKDQSETYRCVFTGDTHFIAGCGCFFEGTAEMMHKNLTTLGELPKDTFIFPGHEYTVDNLKWAMGIEWENEAYGAKLKWAQDKRDKGEYTVPSTVADEFQINIFWRTKVPTIQEKVGSKDPIQVLGTLRDMKNKKVSLAKKE